MHNQPSGDPTPSRADIQMTQAVVEAARSLGIAVQDHVIVAKGGHASLGAAAAVMDRGCAHQVDQELIKPKRRDIRGL